MGIIKKFKNRIEAYVEYTMDEQRYRNQFDVRAVWLTDKTLTTISQGIDTKLKINDLPVVVSLTTYGKRLHEVYLAIESMMQQTLLPSRIILWLSEELKQVPLPHLLQRQVKRGLEVKYCPDWKSYKKLIPTLKICPNDIIITIDDDVIYNYDTLELLIQSYLDYSDCVSCLWGHKINLDYNGRPLSYNKWQTVTDDFTPSTLTFPVGCAGILYPPNSLDSEVLNVEAFSKLAPHADDVWFKSMSLKKAVSSRMVPNAIHEHQYYDNPLWQDKGLTRTNVNQNANDIQFDAVLQKYCLFNQLYSKKEH